MTSDESVLYLYGLVRPSTSLSGIAGIEHGCDVLLVERDDVACAVSVVPARDYQRLPDASSAAEQLEWITPRAWRHHEMLRRLHLKGTVVPLKFGTLCASLEQVDDILRDHRDTITALLARFDGKDEWTLKVHVDEEALAEALQRTEPALVALKEEATRVSDGRAYFVRKKLQKATNEMVADEVVELEQEVCARVRALGFEVSSEEAHPAVLVDRCRFAELEVELAELETDHAAAGLAFDLVGPWPPYGFATISQSTLPVYDSHCPL